MKKITDYSSVTREDVRNKGVIAYYVGKGLGAGKVGLVISAAQIYHIQWSDGPQSLWETSLEQLAKNNSSELYMP